MLLLALLPACGPSGSRTGVEPSTNPSTGGDGPGTGGRGTGGTLPSTGGATGTGGGFATGGAPATGGASMGGAATGGAATGGAATGGAATGGAMTGGAMTGGRPMDGPAPTPDVPIDMPAPVDVAPDAPPSTLAMGLVSRWKLDEGMGTAAADTTATNNGTLSGATWITMVYPGADYPNPAALRFDGTNDHVELGFRNFPAFNERMTIAFWVNYSGLSGSSGQQVAAGFSGPGTSGARLKIGFQNTNISVWRSGGTDLANFAAPAAGWHHIAYSWDTTTNRLYVDGMQRAMSTTQPESGAIGNARLGANSSGTERFRGDIDEVRVYNRALTPAEVMSLAAGME